MTTPDRAPRKRARLHLVTCGSPLSSLYGTFFPATFDGAFFARAVGGVASWRNYWRETDPIATCLPRPL